MCSSMVLHLIFSSMHLPDFTQSKFMVKQHEKKANAERQRQYYERAQAKKAHSMFICGITIKTEDQGKKRHRYVALAVAVVTTVLFSLQRVSSVHICFLVISSFLSH